VKQNEQQKSKKRGKKKSKNTQPDLDYFQGRIIPDHDYRIIAIAAVIPWKRN
jgi:hypothetical protein